MSARTLPTPLIVPGGWHPPSLYEPFANALNKLGFPAPIILKHPSLHTDVDAPVPSTSDTNTALEHDTVTARSQLESLIESDGGTDVIVFAHSWGGLVASGACRGLSASSQGEEKKNGVIGIVYLSAFIIPQGVGVRDFLGGKQAPYVMENNPSQGLCITSMSSAIFYNDMPSATTELSAEELVSQLVPHVQNAFESPCLAPSWQESSFRHRSGFIKQLRDVALPLKIQDVFMEVGRKQGGVEWIVKEIDSGHCSCVTMPERVADLVMEFYTEFLTV